MYRITSPSTLTKDTTNYLRKSGKRRYRQRLQEWEKAAIMEALARGEHKKALADEFGCPYTTICMVYYRYRGRDWLLVGSPKFRRKVTWSPTYRSSQPRNKSKTRVECAPADRRPVS